MVQTDITRSQHYFNFFDVPDMLVRRHVNKSDYEGIISKLLHKVKQQFLVHKSQLLDKPIEQININESDLVPLQMIDHYIS